MGGGGGNLPHEIGSTGNPWTYKAEDHFFTACRKRLLVDKIEMFTFAPRNQLIQEIEQIHVLYCFQLSQLHVGLISVPLADSVLNWV